MSILPSTPAPGPVGRPLARRAWVVPALRELPPLEQLTLQTQGIIGNCDPGGGNCTFSLFPLKPEDVV